jgi:small-conductance mechanosensitive channel
MNDEATTSVPKMFYWISGAALVWNLLGVAAYVGQVTMSPEDLAALPEAQRALYENVPTWVTSAFAIAVNAGALGCLLLVLRKALALPVLIVSLVAVLVQMYHSFFMSNAMEVMGVAAVIGPAFVIIIGIYLVWFANDSKSKGWIT